MSDEARQTTDRAGLSLVRYRARLGFWQAIWGTLISGGIAVAIPAMVDVYKARLDIQKAEQDVQLKNKEIELKKLASHQEYVSSFLNTALNQDIELRLRFSEYFSYVSDKENADQWREFHKALADRRDAIRLSINDKENQAATLRALSKPSVEQQIELIRLMRELDWNYAEVGYARRDSNITVPNSSNTGSFIDRIGIMSDDEQLFRQAVISPDRKAELDGIVGKLNSNKARYETVEKATHVPWYVVGIINVLEQGGRFDTHLHNGDPLTARTVHVPVGRPIEGSPPFSWEASAIDAIKFSGINNNGEDFSSAGGILFVLERYNGFGFRSRGIKSPYIWACTNLYTSGRMMADGTFSPSAKEPFCGAAAILKSLLESGTAQLENSAPAP